MTSSFSSFAAQLGVGLFALLGSAVCLLSATGPVALIG